MRKQDYVDAVASGINFKKARTAVSQELLGHIDDRIEYYMSIGLSSGEAEEKAVENMGKPDDVAKSMNRLHTSPRLYACIIFLMALYVLCIVLSLTGLYVFDFNFDWVDFAIVSLDSSEVHAAPCLVSLISFAAMAAFFSLSYRVRSSTLLLAGGLLTLVGNIVNIYFLMPFGYTLVGLVTDYPATFFSQTYTHFFGPEISWALDGAFTSETVFTSVVYYIQIALVVLFALGGFVNFIMSVVAAVNFLGDDREDSVVVGRLGKYAMLLIVLAIASAIAFTVEYATDEVRYTSENKQFEATEQVDANAIFEAYNDIELPLTYKEARALAVKNDVPDFELEDAEELNSIKIAENPHFTLMAYDDDQDGTLDCKRIFSSYDIRITDEQVKALKNAKTIDDVFDVVGRSKISDFSQTLNSDKLEGQISINTKKYIYQFTTKDDNVIEFDCVER